MSRPVTLLLAVLLAACGDQIMEPKRQTLLLDATLNVTPNSTLDAQIDTLTRTLFPTGLETAAGTRWETVKTKYAAGSVEEARARLLELIRWVESKNRQMEVPGTGETTTAASTRLVTYMALYVYSGPTTPIPAYNPGADATFEVVEPTLTDTVTTPLGYAGVGVDAGSVAVPTIITISQSVNAYPGTCNGPLKTTKCQYPLFYDFHMYPQAKFLKPVHVAVCHVDAASTTRRPLDAADHEVVHERLRLAHPMPSNINDTTTGATRLTTNGDSIEIAPRSPLAKQGSSGTTCGAAPGYAMRAPSGLLGRMAARVSRALSPRPLYAVDLGPEHGFEYFSPINLVDPESQPDLTLGPMSATPTSALPGDAVSTTFTVFNTSPVNGGNATATSAAGTATFYLSSDAVITSSDVSLGSVPLSALVPDASQPISATSVVIPATTVPGAYHLGVIASQPITEVSTSNNTASTPITVQSAGAPLSAAAMGTTLNAGSGTPTVDGQIGANEWASSECGSFPVNTPQGGTTTAVLCAKNDATNAYFVYQLTRSVDDPGKSISAEFDTNDDGAIGAWDDTFVHNPTLAGLTDGVRVQCGTNLCGPVDTDEGGQNHGTAAYGFHGTYAVYEVSKPLASGDGRDVSLMPGDAIGFFFDARLINGPTFPADYGDTRYPAVGLMTLQLSGATTIPNPAISFIGTEQYATSQLFDRYSFTVTNQASLPEALFDPMPGLPPCGLNTQASRTWVELIDQAGAVRNSFCAIGSWSQLTGIWFAVSRWVQPPPGLAVRLTDRLRGTTYTQPYNIPLYGPVFNHFPRTLELNWAPMSGAVTYDTYWEYGNGCTTGDWTTCSTTWTAGGTNTGLTGDSHTISFVGAQQGRWQVIGRDAGGTVVGTTAFKYFRFTI